MGAFQDIDPIVTIGQAKHLDSGVTAVIPGVIVTGVFPDSIYVEQVDRAAGLKVRRIARMSVKARWWMSPG